VPSEVVVPFAPPVAAEIAAIHEPDVGGVRQSHFDDLAAVDFAKANERADAAVHVARESGDYPKRQAANIAHELAHGLLLHRPAPLFTSAGVRHYNAEQEEEASWLGPALLISDEAALHIVERKMAIEVASDRYGASSQVIQMRMNVSGATRRVGRRVALDLIH
jgi:hypothetical protein